MRKILVLTIWALFFVANKSLAQCEGDFNGDGKMDTCFLTPPQTEDEKMDCIGDCKCTITFSNKNIKPIVFDQCIGGVPVNLGDLDNNGTDEIGFEPDWWTSCWRAYYVYTYTNNQWKELIPTFSIHCNLEEELVHKNGKFVEKIPNKKGFVKIYYSEFGDDEISTKTKIVKIK